MAARDDPFGLVPAMRRMAKGFEDRVYNCLQMDELRQVAAIAVWKLQQQREAPPSHCMKRAQSAMIDAIRRELVHQRRQASPTERDEEAPFDRPDEVGDPTFEAVIAAEVRAAVDRLPERQRALVRAMYFDGELQREIGQRWGITQSAVSLQHTQALNRLRLELEGAMP